MSTTVHGRVLSVETPEHARLDFPLADLGSRALAITADFAVQIAGGVLIAVVLTLLLGEWGAPGVWAGLGEAVFIVATFVIYVLYFFLFEFFWDGRTPGKRLMGLRVIHVGGEPLSLSGAALRSVIRVVDLLPGGLVGAVSIMATKRSQRVGDIAARTLVVRDGGWGEVPWKDVPSVPAMGRPILEKARFRLLSDYMDRRASLGSADRDRVGGAVWEAVRGQVEAAGWRGLPSSGAPGDADSLLTRLFEDEGGRQAARLRGWRRQAATLARAERGNWEAYRGLLDASSGRGLTRLGQQDLRRFGALFRQLVADLERARTYGAPPAVIHSLGKLVAAGHNRLYRTSAQSLRSVGGWLASGFPQAVRARWRLVVLAGAMLVLPAIGSYLAVRADPVLGRVLAQPGIMHRAETTETGNPDAAYIDVDEADMPLLSSSVTTNNLRVSFFAAAAGIFLGVGAAYVLAFNGVLLGAVFGVYQNTDVLPVILAFVSPHGPIELTAICLAGAAGMSLGVALLAPGRRSRRQALAEQGIEALSLLGGACVMLLVAGAIEGFISPSAAVPASLKFVFGGLTLLFMVAYFGLAGRRGVPGTGT